MAYLGRGKPKSELRVNFNKGFEKMFDELSLQISRNLVTSEYAKVNIVMLNDIADIFIQFFTFSHFRYLKEISAQLLRMTDLSVS